MTIRECSRNSAGQGEVAPSYFAHPPAVALAGVAKSEFEGVPSVAGPGAALNEKLAVFRKLVEQGKTGGKLPLEELFGVIDEGALFLRQRALVERFQHGALLKAVKNPVDHGLIGAISGK